MSAAVVTDIMLGVLTAAVGFVAFIASTRANREQAKARGLAVDAAAYARAKDIYEGALDSLKEEMERMRAETARVRESNDSLRKSNDALRLEIHRLRDEVSALRAGRDTSP